MQQNTTRKQQSWILSNIIPVFSVTWPFRNHSNTMIWCSRNISHYYYVENNYVHFYVRIFWWIESFERTAEQFYLKKKKVWIVVFKKKTVIITLAGYTWVSPPSCWSSSCYQPVPSPAGPEESATGTGQQKCQSLDSTTQQSWCDLGKVRGRVLACRCIYIYIRPVLCRCALDIGPAL